MHSISETIKILRGEQNVHLDVFIREDKCLIASIKVPVGVIQNVSHLESESFGSLAESDTLHLESHSWVTLWHVDH